MDDLVAHKFDLAMSGITIRPERALVATFSRPYLIAGAVVLVADAQRFSSLETVNQSAVRLEDLQQEACVLEKIAALATQKALDPATVQDLFRIQIDMAKQVQRGVLQSQQAIPAWAQGRDLRQELRPTLNQLSTRIVQELACVAPLIRNRAEIFTTAQQEITNDTVTKRQHFGLLRPYGK